MGCLTGWWRWGGSRVSALGLRSRFRGLLCIKEDILAGADDHVRELFFGGRVYVCRCLFGRRTDGNVRVMISGTILIYIFRGSVYGGSVLCLGSSAGMASCVGCYGDAFRCSGLHSE